MSITLFTLDFWLFAVMIFKMRLFISFCLLIAATLIIGSCSKSDNSELIKTWKKSGTVGGTNIEYPFEGALFPPEIIPPTFIWKEPGTKAGLWLVVLEIGGEIEHSDTVMNRLEWKPPKELWERVKANSKDKDATFSVAGFKIEDKSKVVAAASVSFRTSNDRVGAPIFYRAVPLPFIYAVNNVEQITWRLGDISSDKEPTVALGNMPVCANCHSFSSDGKFIGMDVDYANDKGSYMIAGIENQIEMSVDKIVSWNDFRREDRRKTFGLLSQLSPDGRYAVSTVKDRSIFVPVNNLFYSQLFFPIRGILSVYDRVEKSFSALSGADNPAFCQSNPSWSPDGKYIIFAKAPVYNSPEVEKSNKVVLPTSVAKDFIEGRTEYKYDLYKIPFNSGKGGNPEPLQGASGNGMSNYFARYSPDGKWIVFTQSKSFMLLQPDSKLYIMPASGGSPRLMKCNTGSMNSWHSWSPNGKWLVFSSKARGPYTQLYLTHIDENGNDSPPVLLEGLSLPNLAANIPEFVNIPESDRFSLSENFMQAEYYADVRGLAKAKSGDFKGALAELSKSIEQNPYNAQSYIERG
ncbi:MAG: hypothetical protein QG635_1927, partial [Bacteroidota bacterium]|nr:hypothetical protein [Bacteroidota bacterium]